MSSIDLEDYKPQTFGELEDRYTGWAPDQLAVEMYNIRGVKEALEAALKHVNAEYDYLRTFKLPRVMEESDPPLERFTLTGIGRISLASDMYVSVMKGMKPKLFEFLRDIGKGDLIKEEVNSSTLKAVVKQMMAGGETIPDDIVKVTPFTRASITKTG